MVRDYSTHYGYRGPRNRNQGIFRDVITLDTPEMGSPLAYYLDTALYPLKEDTSHSLVYGYDAANTLWHFVCGWSNKTLRDCLDKAGLGVGAAPMPLAPPGAPLSEGAVWSLIPTDDHLNQLPDPNIPGATWYSIASNYQMGGSQLPSVTENFLNTFFSALYPKGDPATPTIASMMTDSLSAPSWLPNNVAPSIVCQPTTNPTFRQNDVIVPACSQTYHAIPSQSCTFPGLVHSPISGALKLLLPGKSVPAPAVTESNDVNDQIEYWLGYSDTPSFACRTN